MPKRAIHKQVRLVGLAVYLDTDVEPPRAGDGTDVDLRRCTVERARQYLSTDGGAIAASVGARGRGRGAASRGGGVPELLERHSFLLRPVHATCRVRMEQGERSATSSTDEHPTPALSAEISVKDVALRLSDAQLRDTWMILRTLDEYGRQIASFQGAGASGERRVRQRMGPQKWGVLCAPERSARVLIATCTGLWRGRFVDHPGRRSLRYIGERHAQRLRYAALWLRFRVS